MRCDEDEEAVEHGRAAGGACEDRRGREQVDGGGDETGERLLRWCGEEEENGAQQVGEDERVQLRIWREGGEGGEEERRLRGTRAARSERIVAVQKEVETLAPARRGGGGRCELVVIADERRRRRARVEEACEAADGKGGGGGGMETMPPTPSPQSVFFEAFFFLSGFFSSTGGAFFFPRSSHHASSATVRMSVSITANAGPYMHSPCSGFGSFAWHGMIHASSAQLKNGSVST